MAERIAIFIDGAYLRYVLKDDFNEARIDFEALSNTIAGGKEILRTYYYNCLPYQSNPPKKEEAERYRKARDFYATLERLPRYEVRLGRLEYRGTGPGGRPRFTQKRVDILLSVDMVQLATRGHIQKAILVAGDSDFIPAVQVAKNEGVVVSLLYGSKCHRDLLQKVDERRRLDQGLVDSILLT